jgi:hypothetical protein
VTGEGLETGSAEVARPVDAPARPLEDALLTLPYHQAVIDHLKASERDLWSWFASPAFRERHDEDARLELLKTCYRFDRTEHADLYAVVAEVCGLLGIAAPVTVYQSQNATVLNAFLVFTPEEAHVVFEGPLRARLTAAELRTVIAHELTHYLLWSREGGDLLVAEQMLAAMANQSSATPSHVETWRILRLYLEVHADRGTLAVGRDPLPAISGLLKVQTGLEDVSATAYLRQADEIFSKETVNTAELTHPEAFIRARALSLWAERGQGANAEVARMIEGPLDLGTLTLLGQKRLAILTRKVLGAYLQPQDLRTDGRLAHARLFFPDLALDDAKTEVDDVSAEAEAAAPSVRDYFSYVLLDLATADRQDESALPRAYRMASSLGLEEAFARISGDELKLSKRARAKLKKDAANPDTGEPASAATPSSEPA